MEASGVGKSHGLGKHDVPSGGKIFQGFSTLNFNPGLGRQAEG